jgi:hypothetical protein
MIIKTYVTIVSEADDIGEAGRDAQMWTDLIMNCAKKHGNKFQVEIVTKHGRSFSERPSRQTAKKRDKADDPKPQEKPRLRPRTRKTVSTALAG